MRAKEVLRAGLLVGAMLVAGGANAAGTMHVMKNSGCGCCVAWIDYLREAGFEVETENVASGALIGRGYQSTIFAPTHHEQRHSSGGESGRFEG